MSEDRFPVRLRLDRSREVTCLLLSHVTPAHVQ